MDRIIHTVLEAGLEKPVKILQVTDVHLTESAAEDPIPQQAFLNMRRHVFIKEGDYPAKTPSEYFEEAFRIADQMGALVVATGDVMDACSKGNRDELFRIAGGRKNFMFTPGSHDFGKFAGWPASDDDKEEYWPQQKLTRPMVQAMFPDNDFYFDSRVFGGVNVVTIDSGFDYIRPQDTERLIAEADKGLPMVVFTHDPLDTGYVTRTSPRPSFWQFSTEDYRSTDAALSFLGTCPLVLGIFTGHIHSEAEYVGVYGMKLWATPGLYRGTCRVIEIR